MLQENLQEWLMDPRGRDQFVVRHGDETEVRLPSPLPAESFKVLLAAHNESPTPRSHVTTRCLS